MVADDAITTPKSNFISTSSGAGVISKGTSGDSDGYIQLNCSENSHGVKIKSPAHSAAQSYTLTLPGAAPAVNKFIETDGSGNLSFSSVDVTTDITGTIPTANLGTGTADATTFLRGDQTYAEAGGGDMVRLNTTTVSSSVSTLSMDTVFSSTYKIYKLFYCDVNYSTSAYMDMQFLVSGAVQNSADYNWKAAFNYGALTASGWSEGTKNTTSGFRYTQGYYQNNADHPESGEIVFFNPNDNTMYNAIQSHASCYDGSNWRDIYGTGYYTGGKISATGIKFTVSSGTIDSGTYMLYGIKSS